MEAYPIVIDGELAGKLTAERQGARTAFYAECRPLPGLVRISVYGGGREGYLGLLAPEGGKLTLRKTLSRDAMRAFPTEIESVERAGREPPVAADEKPKMPAHESREAGMPAQETGTAHGAAPDGREDAAAETDEKTEESCDMPEIAAEPKAESEPDRDCPPEKEQNAPPEDEGPFWYSSPDGALVCFDGTQTLLALPPEDPRIPAGTAGERRVVEGREYVVFPARDERVIR